MSKQSKIRVSKRGRVLLTALIASALATAHASVAVLLEQPYGSLALTNPTGHSAVYLDHICADGPTRLRVCQPGEMGVVISRYDGISGHDWIAMPLIPYLYGVDRVEDIPNTMNRPGEIAIRDAYRRAHLESIAPDRPDGTAPEGNWYELAGAAYDRTIYGFEVKTTPEQDASLVDLLNDRTNKERYNAFFVNCADFARTTINRFYPHAIRRNFISDAGMTTPKWVARSLSHYAAKHPEIELHTFIVPQVKGDIPRSHEVTGISEGLLKRYVVPMAIFAPVTTGVTLVAYIGHGRFAMPKNAPQLELHDFPAPVAANSIAEAASGGVTPVRASIGGAPSGLHTAGMLFVGH